MLEIVGLVVSNETFVDINVVAVELPVVVPLNDIE